MIAPVLPTYARADLEFERGEGAYLVAPNGERYLDLGAGIAVNSLGHAHPVLVEALNEQASRLWHTSNLYRVPGQEALAEKLVSATFADTVFFCNSGAEAVECAIKMARKYQAVNGRPERYELITFEGAFHGRTLATIAAGGQAKYLEGFGPAMPGFVQVPFADTAAVRAAIGEKTAGILLEPIQGEGGIRSFEPEFLRSTRALCDEHELLLLFDEVQCGMGRTGHLFAHQSVGVVPDIMAIAKALGGGFPVGACLATADAAAGMTAGTHGSTFGGNPLAMAVGSAAFDLLSDQEFLDKVRDVGLRLKQRLAMVVDRYPNVVEGIRGDGLMLGLKCRVPNGDLVSALIDQHVLTVGAGDNVVRLLPPLVIGDQELDEAIAALESACAQLSESNDSAETAA